MTAPLTTLVRAGSPDSSRRRLAPGDAARAGFGCDSTPARIAENAPIVEVGWLGRADG